jgi:hypothetical protein
MRRVLEQKWLTYLEVYGGGWSPRQMDSAHTLFYAGATALLQCVIQGSGNTGDEPTEEELDNMRDLRLEIEEFAARNRSRS